MKHIDYSTNPYKYYDKNGTEILEGDIIIMNGRRQKVYLLEDECSLGTDATNPRWIETGRAVPCEYGCYPLNNDDLEDAILVLE